MQNQLLEGPVVHLSEVDAVLQAKIKNGGATELVASTGDPAHHLSLLAVSEHFGDILHMLGVLELSLGSDLLGEDLAHILVIDLLAELDGHDGFLGLD